MMPLLLVATLAQPMQSGVEGGFVSLSSDPDLSAWRLPKPGAWVCEDGALRKAGGGTLFTRAIYQDFTLRLEYRIGKGGNSGLFVRAPLSGRHSALGMEVQILGDHGRTEPNMGSTGALYAAKAPRAVANRPNDEWNALEVELIGRHMKVALNDSVIHDFEFDDPELNAKLPHGRKLSDRCPRGFIGLQDHGAPIEFRNVRIKVEPEQDFEPLFDGTLDGWTADSEGAFSAQDGVLVCTAPKEGTATLRHERVLADHEVRLEYRVQQGAEAYWLPRTDDKPRHRPVEIVIGDDTGRAPGVNATGALAGQASTMMRGSLPVGQWNDLRMVFRGRNVEICLNEMPVLNTYSTNFWGKYMYAPLKGVPKLVIRKGRVELRKVRVKEL